MGVGSGLPENNCWGQHLSTFPIATLNGTCFFHKMRWSLLTLKICQSEINYNNNIDNQLFIIAFGSICSRALGWSFIILFSFLLRPLRLTVLILCPYYFFPFYMLDYLHCFFDFFNSCSFLVQVLFTT